MNLEHIYSLCAQLQQISSTKEKEKFLVDNQCDEFNEFLKWLLDPQIVTGIDKKKLNKPIGIIIKGILTLDMVLEHLKAHNTGASSDVALCQQYINCFPEYKDFLTDVFTKRLKLGVNIALVNKAYGKNFIYKHSVRLGSPRDKLRLKTGQWFSLSQKMDGVRATFVDGKMMSRQGKEMVGLEHITKHLKAFNERHNCNMVFDGELIRANVDGIPDNENFRLTTSIVNGDDGDKSQLEYVMFDCLPLDEFYEGESQETYKTRRLMVENVIINMCLSCNDEIPIRPVPIFYQGSDTSEIDKQLALADAKGYEGLMLDKDTKYYCKRDTGLIKIKTFRFSDLRVTGYFEGEGKYTGQLGGVIVDYKGNEVRVGSGFDDAERIELWKNPEALVGRIITVKYKEVSKDSKTGKESLQFPVAFGWRDDKDTESYE